MNQQSKKRDVYEIITDRIIEKLEQGVVPWHQPWTESGLPRNLVSKKPYRGINVLLLSSLGYQQNFFLTHKQIEQLGGSVKESEKPYPVCYWNWPEKGENEESKKVPIFRYYSVFNIEQCEGLPIEVIPERNPFHDNPPLEVCEAIVEEMPKKPMIKFKENRAYYHPFFDFINMPKMKTFTSSETYYCTLFHELIHSTGHLSRLNRKEVVQMKSLGADAYSIEELIAETGACFLCSMAGISELVFDNSASYINAWLERLKNDKRLIVYASAKAQKAVDFITCVKGSDFDETTES